jgi:hypothetical protein
MNLVDGEWTTGSTEKWHEVHNPATQEVVTKVPETSHQDMVKIVDGAEKAFHEWKDSSHLRRQGIMLKCAYFSLTRCERSEVDTFRPEPNLAPDFKLSSRTIMMISHSPSSENRERRSQTQRETFCVSLCPKSIIAGHT